MGIDAELEDRIKSTLDVKVIAETQINTFKKDHTSDSGVEQTLRYFTERDSYLVTVSRWDTIDDKETCLRTVVVPMLSDRFKLDPRIPVVFLFLDTKGNQMRHIAGVGPKVMGQ